LLGGTFDPIHFGHLRPAQAAMQALSLDRLHVIPALTPPLRAAPVATAAQRLDMVRLACAEFPGFTPDDRELRRDGPSYTVDTLTSLRAELGNEVSLCWLVGADAFAAIDRWRDAKHLFDLAHFIVMARPGSAPLASPDWLRTNVTTDVTAIRTRPHGAVLSVAEAQQDISASMIRARLASGESVTGLLPEAVSHYLHAHHLYESH
jgi:nicotinate-nucleotide adenylyltransferase